MAKCDWTMERARAWVAEHSKVPKAVSQDEIRDEIDYLTTTIKAKGLSKENEELAWKLTEEILRLSGGDIPVEIQNKIGAVLNRKNLDRLQQIQALAQEIIDSAKREPEEPTKAIEPEITLGDIGQIVKGEVARAFRKAQGKLN